MSAPHFDPSLANAKGTGFYMHQDYETQKQTAFVQTNLTSLAILNSTVDHCFIEIFGGQIWKYGRELIPPPKSTITHVHIENMGFEKAKTTKVFDELLATLPSKLQKDIRQELEKPQHERDPTIQAIITTLGRAAYVLLFLQNASNISEASAIHRTEANRTLANALRQGLYQFTLRVTQQVETEIDKLGPMDPGGVWLQGMIDRIQSLVTAYAQHEGSL